MLVWFLLQHNLAKANKYNGSINSITFIKNISAIYIKRLKIDTTDLQVPFHESGCQEAYCNITLEADNWKQAGSPRLGE